MNSTLNVYAVDISGSSQRNHYVEMNVSAKFVLITKIFVRDLLPPSPLIR